jgi:hypothetical protein
MIGILLALAGLALTVPASAPAAKHARPPATKPAKPAPRAGDTAKIEVMQSAAATRVFDWIAASGDNGALPYIVIDKNNAALFLFDAKGQLLGKAPGRFLARYGLAAGRQKVLWVDYATSVALHPIPTGYNPKERRRQRMASPTSDDNRITFGCINVPSAFYSKSVQPLFRKKGGYVYILPDTKPLETVFPLLLGQTVASGGSH